MGAAAAAAARRQQPNTRQVAVPCGRTRLRQHHSGNSIAGAVGISPVAGKAHLAAVPYQCGGVGGVQIALEDLSSLLCCSSSLRAVHAASSVHGLQAGHK
jgi:hypothetical protein